MTVKNPMQLKAYIKKMAAEKNISVQQTVVNLFDLYSVHTI